MPDATACGEQPASAVWGAAIVSQSATDPDHSRRCCRSWRKSGPWPSNRAPFGQRSLVGGVVEWRRRAGTREEGRSKLPYPSLAAPSLQIRVTSRPQSPYPSTWIGLDGCADGTVEQIGPERARAVHCRERVRSVTWQSLRGTPGVAERPARPEDGTWARRGGHAAGGCAVPARSLDIPGALDVYMWCSS